MGSIRRETRVWFWRAFLIFSLLLSSSSWSADSLIFHSSLLFSIILFQNFNVNEKLRRRMKGQNEKREEENRQHNWNNTNGERNNQNDDHLAAPVFGEKYDQTQMRILLRFGYHKTTKATVRHNVHHDDDLSWVIITRGSDGRTERRRTEKRGVDWWWADETSSYIMRSRSETAWDIQKESGWRSTGWIVMRYMQQRLTIWCKSHVDDTSWWSSKGSVYMTPVFMLIMIMWIGYSDFRISSTRYIIMWHQDMNIMIVMISSSSSSAVRIHVPFLWCMIIMLIMMISHDDDPQQKGAWHQFLSRWKGEERETKGTQVKCWKMNRKNREQQEGSRSVYHMMCRKERRGASWTSGKT